MKQNQEKVDQALDKGAEMKTQSADFLALATKINKGKKGKK